MSSTFNEIVKYAREGFREGNIIKQQARKKDTKEKFINGKKIREKGMNKNITNKLKKYINKFFKLSS